MKNLKEIIVGLSIFTLIATAPALMSCMKPMSETAVDENAGTNGGFEITKNNLPVNWLVYTPKTTGEGDFNYSFDSENFKEGKQSLKIQVNSCSSKGGRFSPGIAQEIPVQAGETYKVSFWLKNSASFEFNLNAVNVKEKSSGPNLKSTETSTDWRLYTYDYVIPEKMNRLRMEFSVLQTGTCWLDGLMVEKLR